ncbi:MAG: DUF4105 domain-containing protein [Prevotellaceae bacterium]|jgi:hypothetical protein|nr:DUF4105 domain-containing protein [Prevotellaceae bacterium]
MKKVVLYLCLIAAIPTLDARELSDACRISLLTCDPGKEVYARFGHTAIRVVDAPNDYDVVYHYGVFDFETDGFLLRFIRGETDYQIGKLPTNIFLDEYNRRRSTVVEQTLNLSIDEKRRLNTALETNYLPENRIYRYNFIYDNCATRPFVIINNAPDTAPTLYASRQSATTFRSVIGEYVGSDTWLKFGIDILIGREADEPVFEQSLIGFPLYMMRIVSNEMLESGGSSRPLASSAEPLFIHPPLNVETALPITGPVWVCCMLLIVVAALSFLSWQRKRYMLWLDVTLFAIFGILGCVVGYMTFFSLHPLVDTNLNLLWMNPLQLLFALAIINKRWRSGLSYFGLFNALTTLIAIVVCVTHIQGMHPAFLPLMGIMMVRSVMFFQMHKLKS